METKLKKLCMMAVICCASLFSCNDDFEPDELLGEWYEYYDPTIFAMDGSRNFSFMDNNTCVIVTYDVFSGKTTKRNVRYIFDSTKKKLTLSNGGENDETVVYDIVRLTSKELTLQKEGTEYSINVWGVEYRYFKRINKNN